MGAWGYGSFENDSALDWASGVTSVADVRKPFERLKQETDAADNGGEMVLDADFASELMAAAECVALMMGRVIPGFPEDLQQRLADAGGPDDLLFHQARNAVMHVTRKSELAELWEEAAEGEDTNDWLVEISELVDRLNPELEYYPPSLPEVSAEDTEGEAPVCAFCRLPVSESEFVGMNVTHYEDIMESSRIMPIHLKCLNARLHHSTAIIEFKFDPDRPIDLDDL